MRYWAQQAVELCDAIDDESLESVKLSLLDAMESMGKDRRVVLIGASRSGKSALLAGMVGAPVLARVSPVHHYTRWRYMDDGGDACHCRFLPESNLYGMELVDTRGCENPAVAESVAPMLAEADAVVAVVDAREVPSSPVWEMMAALSAEGGPSCLVAITHTDYLGAEQTVTLGDSVRNICQERIGRVLPVYQLNSTNPTLADDFGSKVVAAMERSSGGLRAAIREVMKRGGDLLYKQGSILKARDAVARTDSGFLQSIEQEIDNFQNRQNQGVRNCVLNYSAAAQRCMPRLLHHLRRSMGWFLSPVVLLRLESYASASETLYYNLVLQDVIQQQEELDKQFVHSCNGHWRSVRPRMKQALQCEIGEFPDSDLVNELSELRLRLQNSLHEPFRILKVRSHFAALFKCQVDWMRFFTTCMCLSLIIAGLLGFFMLESLALIFMGISAAFWLLGTVIHLLVVRKICLLMRKEAEPLRDCLATHMMSLVQDMIVSRVAAYRRLYTGPRQRVADYETTLVPLQQRQSEIFRQLRSAAPHV